MIHVSEGLLQAHLDGEMLEADRVALESHLAVCPACRAEQDELRRASEMFRAALLGCDEVAGTRTALVAFTSRRHALEGAPAAANGAAPRQVARRRHATFRAPLRLARASLLKAAALVLLLAGAASAAIPQSPVRRLIDGVLSRVADSGAPVAPAPAVPPSEPEPAPPPEEQVRSGAILAAPDGALSVRLRSPGARARIHVRLVDDADAAIRRTDQGSVELETGRGWIELRNLGDADIFVDLPRSADQLTVEVDGQVYFERVDGRIRLPGPVVDGDRGEYVFRSRY